MITWNNVPVIKKTYVHPLKKMQEKTHLQLLQTSNLVPMILKEEENYLLLSYIEGLTVKQYLETYEKENDLEKAKTILKKVINYLKQFHKYTNYKICKNDNHLDNYILSKNQIIGIDFEETKEGNPIDDYCNLIAFMMSYYPQNTQFKQQLFQYIQTLLQDVIEPKKLIELVHKQQEVINIRRNVKKIDCGCCIVAGGKATRMQGFNKARLLLGGISFLDVLTMTLSFSDNLYISVSKDHDQETSISKIYDEFINIGPIGAIYSVLKKTKEDSIFFIACDTPFIQEETIQAMLYKANKEDLDCLVGCNKEGRYQPLCAIYKKSCLPTLESMIQKQEYKINKLFQHLKTQTYLIEDKELQNINTYEAYTQIEL